MEKKEKKGVRISFQPSNGKMNYNYDHYPNYPAPILEIRISDPKKEKSTFTDALLDTGSFITAIHPDFAKELPLTERAESVEIFGELKPTVFAYIFFLDFEIFERIALWEKVKKFAIIGRNTLNRYKILLDGKNENFEIKDP